MKTTTALFASACLIVSCSPGKTTYVDEYPPIFPDYTEVTVPENIAELKFKMADERRFKKSSRVEDGTEWITVTAWKRGDKQSVQYKPFPIFTSADAIDPYIVYRLIEPGYESWRYISINQRSLSSFDEKTIVDNRANDNGCLNCHTFQNGNPDNMMLHARGKGGGTVFVTDGDSRILNLAETGPKKQGAYPAWHPSGRYVVYSSNKTKQCFTIVHTQPVEVYDTDSDLIFLDLETDSVKVFPQVAKKDILETFPSWSEDGKTLYFCAAGKIGDIAENRGKVHYALEKISFENGSFKGEPELVYKSPGASVSFPREKGGEILFTLSAFGTFPIWHKEADLWMLNLGNGEAAPAENLNSDNTESYHSWSSNGKWVIFSSRRIDGRYTRLYIAHYDGNGRFSKPFLLPQEDPDLNGLNLKSYNLPEFVKGEVPECQETISKLF